jgi:hypothetical protein
VLEIGVLLGVEVFEALEQQRLHPVRVVRIERRRHQEKLLERAPVLDRLDTQRCRQCRVPPRAVTEAHKAL